MVFWCFFPRSEVHLTALIESCPYMPTTFRDFVKLAGRMGPAQPLAVSAGSTVTAVFKVMVKVAAA